MKQPNLQTAATCPEITVDALTPKSVAEETTSADKIQILTLA
jgi:hypothetical protein